MKKIILGLIALQLLTISAYAMTGYLDSEQDAGMNKFCYYSNDTVVTVKAYEMCPISNG